MEPNVVTVSFKVSRELEAKLNQAISGRYTSLSEGCRSILDDWVAEGETKMEKKDLIPFKEWSQERIEAGVKHCTSRHKRYPKDPRVEWISPKLPWWFIREYLWKPEGAYSPDELQGVINSIYKREVPEDERFYVHFGKFKKER
ncbi:hypothetical protein ACFLRF_04855 [Candidatus Altiarchaeota archaeon]